MPIAIALLAALALARPTQAQTPPGFVPANPFASNYPSAPPPAATARRPRGARGRLPEGSAAPVPPGRIPR